MISSVLLVKTSSLGDLVHALPAVSDIRSACADARIDWVVEQPFAAIPRLHAGISGVIPVAIRRWRKAPWQRQVRVEVAACVRQLRSRSYDAVVDAQGLLKSALIALAARGTRFGLDLHSSREPVAPFYHRTFRVSRNLHAVERNRRLLSLALGYSLPPRCDYGISGTPQSFDWLRTGAYAVLLHATSGDHKLWPRENWTALGSALAARGIRCVLPWGSAAERERSERIAVSMSAAVVPPALSLEQLAGLLCGARAVVGVDTGLTHLAAALGAATIGVYCATDPAATGIYGCARALNIGGIGRTPGVADALAALESLRA